jgi:hypothetical protein
MSPARAEEAGPADTAAFVSYCEDPDHFNICRLMVVEVNNKTLITLLMNHAHGCITQSGSRTRCHSITSSARSKTEIGRLSTSALTVLDRHGVRSAQGGQVPGLGLSLSYMTSLSSNMLDL